jgi:Leucine-rich repeat (LRR) protein
VNDTECVPFAKLVYLNISNNRIRELPELMASAMTSLRTLFMSGNHLKQLPAVIPLLTSLTKLDLSNNELQKLPVQEVSYISNIPNFTTDVTWFFRTPEPT